MAEADDIATDVHQFIIQRFPQAELDHDQDIFELGFINSLFATELVLFVEATFGCEIPDEELTLDNFRSVAAIAGLVQRLFAATSPG